jgi:hypothetical protein
MRDPTDLKVEDAIEDVVAVLGLALRLGAFDHGSPDDVNVQARIEVAIASLRGSLSKHVCTYIEQVLLERAQAERDAGPSDRDAWIVAAIAELERRGFRPHRRGRHESGCSIVTLALARLGIHKSERTIEDIWRNRDATRAPFEWPLRLSVLQNVREK